MDVHCRVAEVMPARYGESRHHHTAVRDEAPLLGASPAAIHHTWHRPQVVAAAAVVLCGPTSWRRSRVARAGAGAGPSMPLHQNCDKAHGVNVTYAKREY